MDKKERGKYESDLGTDIDAIRERDDELLDTIDERDDEITKLEERVEELENVRASS